jgi:hypothetical protein
VSNAFDFMAEHLSQALRNLSESRRHVGEFSYSEYVMRFLRREAAFLFYFVFLSIFKFCCLCSLFNNS